MENSEIWKIITEKTERYWLELEDPEGWFSAGVKCDGCVHLFQYGNVSLLDLARKSKNCSDAYIHICELDDFIKKLESLKELAKKHFGEKWR